MNAPFSGAKLEGNVLKESVTSMDAKRNSKRIEDVCLAIHRQ